MQNCKNASKAMMLYLCRSLIGGGIFITTVVLSTVIMVTKDKIHTIGNVVPWLQLHRLYCEHCSTNADKIDFMRDIFAFMTATGVIIAVAFDGVVSNSPDIQAMIILSFHALILDDCISVLLLIPTGVSY